MMRNSAGVVLRSGVEMDNKKKILIVEDNELNMKLFHDLLEVHGYETLQTKDGREALQLAREHRPDLILMDIQLPEVSGLEVTKWIKADDELKMIPVIAVTAFAMKGDEEKIRSGGCEAYIAKPISVNSFLETIQTVLGQTVAG
tara:strand:+ start:26066 stop:26497 length:432 start_codon:yes stop_codon:yes gene_type:complete